MSDSTDTGKIPFVAAMLDTRLVARATVLVLAYMVSLIVLFVAIIAGYIILSNEMVTQRALSEARTHISALHRATSDSVSLMLDYREANVPGNHNSRLVQVIGKRIYKTIAIIDEHGDKLESTMVRLEGTAYWAHFEWINQLVNDEKGTLLEKFTVQMRQLVERKNDLGGRAVRPQIPAEAAGARYGALSINFREASDQLADVIQKHSVRVESVHKQLTTLIVVILLLMSLLIVLPLWRRLIREHGRHEQAHKQLYRFAYTDQETGLPNLNGLEMKFLSNSASVQSVDEHYLLLVRVSNLDEIYNLIGSQQIVQLHKAICERLNASASNAKYWSRSSESEYCTIISQQCFDDSEDWVEPLFNDLTSPVNVAGILVRPVINMAISQVQKSRDDGCSLMREQLANARMALPFFERNTLDLPVYKTEYKQELANKNELITAITDGVEKNEFVPFYQIKMEAVSGEPCSMEVLCRWITADGSIISPDKFIPAAEKSGQIVPMTYRLLEKIVEDARMLSSKGLVPRPVAINVSVDVLQHREFVMQVCHARDELLAVGSDLDIEITENVAIDNSFGFTRQILSDLSRLGVRIAIDDFGTGYASLQTLIDLPFEVLKLDRSFLHSMTKEGLGSEVVSAMITLSSKLGKRSVIEGVEHEWQWYQLARMGADELQGYYFHKPACIEDVSDWLHSNNHWRKAA